MELLEGKLAVLRFQLKIKEALDRMASGGSTGDQGGSAPMEEDGFPFAGVFVDESRAHAARVKSEELSTELKSITQLYNDYACRFELWEVSRFCTYSGLLQWLEASSSAGVGFGDFCIAGFLGACGDLLLRPRSWCE
jgi:nuclear pore complex protein Nup155